MASHIAATSMLVALLLLSIFVLLFILAFTNRSEKMENKLHGNDSNDSSWLKLNRMTNRVAGALCELQNMAPRERNANVERAIDFLSDAMENESFTDRSSKEQP